MAGRIHTMAGRRMAHQDLVGMSQMRTAYMKAPMAGSVVKNGTSGHRGVTGEGFTAQHVAAMTQSLVDIKTERGAWGPDAPASFQKGDLGTVVLGKDVRYTSDFATRTAAEVFAGNGVRVVVNKDGRSTPTPVVSHTVLAMNRDGGNTEGAIVTASHNPPDNGGYKSNGLDGGPNTRTAQIDTRANHYMNDPSGIRRMDYAEAVDKGLIIEQDLVTPFATDLANVVRMDIIRQGRFAASPLGGSAVGYYEAVNELHETDIEVVLGSPDPAGESRTRDWDGKLRGDPSSAYAMMAIAGERERLEVPFIGVNDNDADRFGGEDSTGILNPNHVLAVCFDYLARTRRFDTAMGIGRTIGTSHILDLIAANYGRPVNEVNVGFKYYVAGLKQSLYVLAGEESAGFSLPRMDGTPWVTEKDGIAAVLLMMEIIAESGKDIGTLYGELVARHGVHNYERIDAPATDARKGRVQHLAKNPEEVRSLLEGKRITGRAIERTVIGDGVKVVLEGGLWVLKRPSGTEPLVKDYREIRDGDLAVAAKASEEIDHLLNIPS